MLENTFSKVMWIGRATVFTVGLAVILALTVGLATAALAGTDVGAPFDLGQTNTVDATSTLVGTVAGSSLRIDNNSSSSAATALDLQVEPGKTPMTVNSDTKVANLNADKIDGKDSRRFATDTEVDTRVAEAKDDAWVYVISNGTFHASSGPNVSVTHPATGKYCFVVPARYSYKAAQVTLADPGGTNIVSVGTGHTSECDPLDTTTTDIVPVYITRPNGTGVDGNFTIFVPAP